MGVPRDVPVNKSGILSTEGSAIALCKGSVLRDLLWPYAMGIPGDVLVIWDT